MIIVALLALSFAVQAFVGPSRWRRRRARIAGNRPSFYRRFMVGCWAFALVAALTVVIDERLTAANVGWAWPATGYAGNAGDTPTTEIAVLTWIFAAYVLVIFWIGGIRVRRRIRAGKPIPGRASTEILLPSTPGERWLAAGTTITGGITHEVVFRGLLIASGVELFHLPVVAAAAISLALYAGAHTYQGIRGVFGCAFVGLILTALVVVSGSIIPGIIVLTAQNLIAMFLIPSAAQAEDSTTEATTTEASTTEASTTEASTTEASTTEQPSPPHTETPALAVPSQDQSPAAQVTLRAPTPRG
jgi:hypothetical protein